MTRSKKICPKITAIFSDNDPFVHLDNIKLFQEKLGAEITMEHAKGHFSGSDGITKLPSALDAILEVAGKSHKEKALCG